ncbi:hypothetical protein [Xanthomarina spongicola]|uniref:TonB-like protein n=1 Tax=Xanthomarina spongicola TaxID=570520 RepID=A0A316DPK0_9FLAO|nr:hypothetical protein [Xanthomarina spongicola]PWK18683.1 hypothetical protein LX78_01990 [Xanthomarina spongicola]
MKTRIFILSTTLIIFSLVIFGFTNWTNTESIEENSINKDLVFQNQNNEYLREKVIPELYYGVDARFEAVNKHDVHNATTIYDFLNEGEKSQIEQIYSVDVIVIKNNQLSQIRARGTTYQLTEAQKKILKSTDYFSHFTIRTEFKGKNLETGKIEDKFFGPHITVTPEKQATYVDGKKTLIEYLKINSKEYMNVIKGDNLGAIKLSFIVTKNGIVTDVKHDAMTTGYPSIDERFIKLLKNIPGKWIPAKNSIGEKMDQELVFTFGPADGC